MYGRSGLWRWCVCVALACWAVAISGAEEPRPNSENTLGNLSETLTAALAEHERQQSALASLVDNYARLQMLSTEQTNELKRLRTDNERLQIRLAAALKTSTEQSNEAKQLADSLNEQSRSYQSYRQASEVQMRRLRKRCKRQWLWIVLGAVGGGIVVGVLP